MTETHTPEYGFPLPSDQSRISKFPWYLRELSRTLEDKLPAALLSTARAWFPSEVTRQTDALRARVDTLGTSVGTALTAAGDAVERVTALESSAGFGPSTPEDGTMAAMVAAPDTLVSAALGARFIRAAVVRPGESIQAALDESAGRWPVMLAAGTHRPTATIHVPAQGYIEGEPGAVLDLAGLPDGAPAFAASGYVEAARALTVDASMTSAALTVSDVAGISAGDWVRVQSASTFGSTSQKRGELGRVAGVSGSVITLEDPLSDSYAVADGAAVARVEMGPSRSVHGLEFLGPEDATRGVIGIDFTLIHAPMFSGLRMRRVHQAGIYLTDVPGASITRCHWYDARRAGFAYGVAVLYASQDVTITGCTGMKMRHLVTIGGGTARPGIARRIAVSGCTASQCDDAGFDVHPGGEHVSFTACHVKGSATDGFVLQGGATTISGCTVDGAARHGVLVQGLTIRGIQASISGSTIRGGASGVTATASTETRYQTQGQLTITGTTMTDVNTGVAVSYSAGGVRSFTDVQVTGSKISALTSHAVSVRGFSGATITGNRLRCYGSAGNTVHMLDSGQSTISGNVLDGTGVASRGVNLINADRTAITGNRIMQITYGIYTDAASSVAMAGNINSATTKTVLGAAVNADAGNL